MPRTNAVLTPAPEPPKLPVIADALVAAEEPDFAVFAYDYTVDYSLSESF